ncbi:MAG TPA: hypothetical protein PLI21_05435, partial [Methanomassiliicoccaceae archaeon]|nr:hypothetical protein [Methanomassiliicoccaceae archaeon]
TISSLIQSKSSDVDGFFLPAATTAGAAEYYPVTPYRLSDTHRNGYCSPDVPCVGPGRVPAGRRVMYSVPNALQASAVVTDLVVSANIDMTDLVAVLRGLQRVSKKWGGIIYLVLTEDVLDKRMQNMIMDSVDGALAFEWSRHHNTSRRQRYMYVEKFISLLPHLDKERIARFATTVTARSGLVVIDAERIV